jgi:hypothetical protein
MSHWSEGDCVDEHDPKANHALESRHDCPILSTPHGVLQVVDGGVIFLVALQLFDPQVQLYEPVLVATLGVDPSLQRFDVGGFESVAPFDEPQDIGAGGHAGFDRLQLAWLPPLIPLHVHVAIPPQLPAVYPVDVPALHTFGLPPQLPFTGTGQVFIFTQLGLLFRNEVHSLMVRVGMKNELAWVEFIVIHPSGVSISFEVPHVGAVQPSERLWSLLTPGRLSQ